jgi:hypothetical protein
VNTQSKTAVIVWVLLEIYLKRFPLIWVVGGGQYIRIHSLGVKSKLGFIGVIILFLVPLINQKLTKQPISKHIQLVKLYGIERPNPEDNQYTEIWADKLTRRGWKVFVYSDIEEMVDEIVMRLDKGELIQELSLYGHGAPGVFSTGNGQRSHFAEATYISTVNERGKKTWQKLLEPLRRRFCDGAKMNLIGCNVGANKEGAQLLFELSKYLGVIVRAPVGITTSRVTYKGSWQEANPGMQSPPESIEPPRSCPCGSAA